MAQKLRYAAVGAGATGVHYLVLVALVEALRWPPAGATFAGATIGAGAAYFGNRSLTFASGRPIRESLPRFLAVAGVGACVNTALLWSLTRSGLHYLPAQVLATLAVFYLTYWMNRAWTFI
jgi:putative flippase GtrA